WGGLGSTYLDFELPLRPPVLYALAGLRAVLLYIAVFVEHIYDQVAGIFFQEAYCLAPAQPKLAAGEGLVWESGCFVMPEAIFARDCSNGPQRMRSGIELKIIHY
ncbi:MAG: hypothetical protein RBS57_16540, partial [Desulforhabdus sp.]|nr:hypothetical protein [Desulforhabdus sp.]